MTREEHQRRHVDLHQALDELLADYITNNNGSLGDSIESLVRWSFQQTRGPDHGNAHI
jgi:hypothetical protein